MANTGMNENTFDEEEEEEKPRSIFRKPKGEACPRGHVDWETIMRKNQLMSRCRLCGYESAFHGRVVH